MILRKSVVKTVFFFFVNTLLHETLRHENFAIILISSVFSPKIEFYFAVGSKLQISRHFNFAVGTKMSVKNLGIAANVQI